MVAGFDSVWVVYPSFMSKIGKYLRRLYHSEWGGGYIF